VEFLSRNTPDFISPLLWTVAFQLPWSKSRGLWGVRPAPSTRLPEQDSRRRPLETASHRRVALLRSEHHHWPSSSIVACSTMCMCPCKRRPLWAQTVTDVFVYELLRRRFHTGNICFWVSFLKQLLLRNCAVDFVEICNVYVGKMIKPLRRYLILTRYAVVIVIWILASLLLEHNVYTHFALTLWWTFVVYWLRRG